MNIAADTVVDEVSEVMINNGDKNICRLCGGAVVPRFSLVVLQKYRVHYVQCAACQSLQTEAPFWLDEAYQNHNLSSLDTGAVQRNMHNLAACYCLSKLFGVKNVLDIGGGDGLLCRMLRDYDINCYVKDKYASPVYAQGFTDHDFDKPDMVIGFEVLEHFANPDAELDDLFVNDSKILLLSTSIYSGERENWWYLSPESGQHVFFYSKKAMDLIAKKYGYTVIIQDGFILFARDASWLKKAIARLLLHERVCHVLKAFVVILPARGVWKDHLFQVDKSRKAQMQP